MTKQSDFLNMLAAHGLSPRHEGAKPLPARPSLEDVPYEQNKCLQRKSLKIQLCGRGCVRGVSEDGKTHIWVPVRCGKWTCDYCGPKRLRLVRHGIKVECARLKIDRMMTLTLPSKYSGDGFQQLYGAWTLFCQRLRKKFPKAKFHYIACVELQPGRKAPHLHVLTNIFLPQRWISACWRSCGGGRIVDIRKKDIHHMADYITYVSKDFLKGYYPPGTRRFRTSRGVKLFYREKLVGYKWEFFDFQIQQAWDRFAFDGRPSMLGEGFQIFMDGPKEALDKGSPCDVLSLYLPFAEGIYRRGTKKNG